MIVRRVGPEAAEQWRAIRLQALSTAPEAFSARIEDWRDRPLADFAAQIEANATFLAFDGDAPVGCIVWIRDGEDAARAWIGGVFVAGPARGQGVAQALITAALEDARAEGVAELWLDVRESNRRAQAAYLQAGFELAPAGARPDTACSACDLSMWRALR